jgi:hypothetical protein
MSRLIAPNPQHGKHVIKGVEPAEPVKKPKVVRSGDDRCTVVRKAAPS